MPWLSRLNVATPEPSPKKNSTRAHATASLRQARGWRYITLQVADIDAVHCELLGKGVRERLAPVTLGDVARISMILDPDGNWIELSRRASIVGSVS